MGESYSMDNSNESNNKSLTLEDIKKAYNVIKPLIGKILTAVVVRPELYEQMRAAARETADYSYWGGVEIYIDEKQEELYKEFYNREELKIYLNRHENAI